VPKLWCRALPGTTGTDESRRSQAFNLRQILRLDQITGEEEQPKAKPTAHKPRNAPRRERGERSERGERGGDRAEGGGNKRRERGERSEGGGNRERNKPAQAEGGTSRRSRVNRASLVNRVRHAHRV